MKNWWKSKSLTTKIIKRIFAMLMLLIFTLIVFYAYSVHLVEANMVTMSHNTLQIYRNNISNSLHNAERALDEIIYSSGAYDELQISDSNRRYYKSIELLRILNAQTGYVDAADAYFVSSDNVILTGFNSRISGSDKSWKIRKFLENHSLSAEEAAHGSWKLWDVDGIGCYIKYYDMNGVRVGALVMIETLLSDIDKIQNDMAETYVFTDHEGKCYGISGTLLPDVSYGSMMKNEKKTITRYRQNYMMVQIQIEEGQARLSRIVERGNLLKAFSMFQWAIIVLVMSVVVFFVYIILFIRKEIIRPINKLIEATTQIRAGIWDQEIDFDTTIREFDVLKSSFNIMISEIKNLKIKSYEERLERQRAELKYLQMQIKPHFYINALTTIHSMSYKNKSNEIRLFIEALSNHMRYTIRDDVTEVTIEEEIEHVKEYIVMQEIRFPESIFFMQDLEPGTEQIKIPQFLILTFIENSFKYAMKLKEMLSCMVQTRLITLDGENWLKLVVEDDGNGFPEEMLAHLNAVDQDNAGTDTGQYSDDPRHGIGIRNVRRTLRLMHGDNARMIMSNSEPHGARSEVWILIDKVVKDENTNR